MTIQLRFCGKNYDAMKKPYGTTQKLWYYNKLELAIVNYSILGFFLVRGYTYIYKACLKNYYIKIIYIKHQIQIYKILCNFEQNMKFVCMKR